METITLSAYPGMGRVSGFKRKASLILYVIDDYTGMPVSIKQVFVRLRGGKAPIRKDDGYYVFMDLEDGVYTAEIGGGAYCGTVLRDLEVEGGNCPVITVRLMPGPGYRLPHDTARITGEAAPYSPVCAVYRSGKNMLKLLYDYEGGRLIRIFSSDMKSLDGRSFRIQDQEFFTIVRTVDSRERVYQMDHELTGKYKRSSARLDGVLWTQADAQGRFFLAVYGIGQEGRECQVGLGAEPVKLKKITVHPQETIQLRL